MKLKIFIVVVISLTSSFVLAKTDGVAPLSKAEFCESRKDSQYFVRLAHNFDNHLAFRNYGGILDEGLCWWHSLFHRAAIYLSVFRPEQPKPDAATAKKIIHAIAARSKVVEIPGYRNIKEFSKDWEKEIVEKLEAWQLVDGFLKFAWINGLSGSHTTEPEKIKRTLDYIIDEIEDDGDLHWAMWQLEGIPSHGVLLVSGKVHNDKFVMGFLDPNYMSKLHDFDWAPPANTVEGAYGDFVPYIGRKSDLKKFKKAAEKYCEQDTYVSTFPTQPLSNSVD